MQQTEERRRIRGMRKDDVRSQLERRLMWLGLGREWEKAGADSALAQELARGLRRERRAAGSRPGNGYDPLRHLVLVRLARLLRRRGRRDLASITRGGAAAGQDSFPAGRDGPRHGAGRPPRLRRASARAIAEETFRGNLADSGDAAAQGSHSSPSRRADV